VRVFDIGAKDGPQTASDRIVTIPNALSVLRLAALPFVYLDLIEGRWLRAFVLLVVFSATDWFDGYLARRLDQITRLGALLDPISDRALFVVVGVGFVVSGLLPLWAVALLLARDLVVMVGGLVLLRGGRGVPPTSKLGKASTFGLMWALPMFLLARVFGTDVDPQPVLQAAAWFTLLTNTALYYLAAFGYLRVLLQDPGSQRT
jgi:cardiolipin synthase